MLTIAAALCASAAICTLPTSVFSRMILIFMAGFCLAFVSGRRFVAVALLTLLFVPGEAQVIITGLPYSTATGMINLHVLTYLSMGALLAIVLTRPLQLRSIAADSTMRREWLLLGLFVISELLVELSGVRGLRFRNYFADVFLGPIALYLTTMASLNDEHEISGLLKISALSFIIVVILGVAEFYNNSNFIYGKFYLMDVQWYQKFISDFRYTGVYRVTSSLGHPLIVATYSVALYAYSLGGLMVRGRKQTTSTAILVVLLLACIVGVFLSASRAALLIMLLLTLVAFFLPPTGVKRVKSFLTVSICVLLLNHFAGEHLFVNTYARGLDIGESSIMVRMNSLKILVSDSGLPSLLGSGSYSASSQRSMSRYATAGKHTYNYEIGWIISLVEMGLLVMAPYLLMLALSVKSAFFFAYRKQEMGAGFPLLLMLIAIILMFTTYNSFGNRGTLNYLLFYVIALCNTMRYKSRSSKADHDSRATPASMMM